MKESELEKVRSLVKEEISDIRKELIELRTRPMDVEDVALYLGCNRNRVYDLVKRKELAHFKAGRKILLFHPRDVMGFAFRNRVEVRRDKAKNG